MTIFAMSVFDATVIYDGKELFKGQGAATGWAEKLAKEIESRVTVEKIGTGWALIGRETHVGSAREGNLPYPVRALRTSGFLYVKNFKPERWPMGDPKGVTAESAPSRDQLTNDTRSAFADIDASPAKAWLVGQRNNADMRPFVEFAWGKRPAEELYDLTSDPHQTKNVAADPAHAATLEELRAQLMAELRAKQDPRLADDAFDRAPYLNRGNR